MHSFHKEIMHWPVDAGYLAYDTGLKHTFFQTI